MLFNRINEEDRQILFLCKNNIDAVLMSEHVGNPEPSRYTISFVLYSSETEIVCSEKKADELMKEFVYDDMNIWVELPCGDDYITRWIKQKSIVGFNYKGTKSIEILLRGGTIFHDFSQIEDAQTIAKYFASMFCEEPAEKLLSLLQERNDFVMELIDRDKKVDKKREKELLFFIKEIDEEIKIIRGT